MIRTLTTLGLLASTMWTAAAVSTPLVPSAVFSLTRYGAVGDGSTDDGPAIRTALAAAYAAGGGTVMGEAGKNYRVVPIYVSAATYSAWRAIAMPSNVTLDLAGSTLTAVAQAGGADGCIISPDGTESVASDYGAASGWTFRNAVLASTSGTNTTTGNMISIHRCSDVLIENVRTGSGTAYHFIECQRCRRVKVRNFYVGHTSNTGQPEFQFDGNGNPASPAGSFSHTTTQDDVVFERVIMPDLRSDVTLSRRIEMGHGAGTYRRVRFIDCVFAGFAKDGSADGAIFDINSTVASVVVEGLEFAGCTFRHNVMGTSTGAGCISTSDTSNTTIRGMLVERCRFEGSYRSAVKVGTGSSTTATSGNYPLRRGIVIRNNYCAPDQIAQAAGQTGSTRVICVQGCEDALVEANFELSPATETNLTSNSYTSLALYNNKRVICRNNVVIRQQAVIGDMASSDNNIIQITCDNVLALSGSQEVVIEYTGNSWNGVHRVGIYESSSPGSWAAGAYTRVRGQRRNNVAHTMGTFGSHVIVLPLGTWAAPPGTLQTGAASTDNTTAGLYAADNRLISGMSAGLAKHIATALWATNLPNSAGQRVVLTTDMVP